MAFLAKHHAEALPHFLDEMREAYWRHGRQGDSTSWTIDASYEVGAEIQAEVMQRLFGAEIFPHLSEAFRLGKRWRKPKL